MAADRGMGFIRICADVHRVEKSAAYIRAAKRCGLFVAANHMKSYTVPLPTRIEKSRANLAP